MLDFLNYSSVPHIRLTQQDDMIDGLLREEGFMVERMGFFTAVIIPDNTHLNRYRDNTAVATSLMSMLAQDGGGSFRILGQGMYRSKQGFLMTETFHLVGCCYQSASAQQKGIQSLNRFLRYTMMDTLQQESVSLWVNGKMRLVFP